MSSPNESSVRTRPNRSSNPDTANACTFAIYRAWDAGGSGPTLGEAVRHVAHPLTGRSKDDLVEIVAFLACRVVGLERSRNADAVLAMAQIGRSVDEFRARHGGDS